MSEEKKYTQAEYDRAVHEAENCAYEKAYQKCRKEIDLIKKKYDGLVSLLRAAVSLTEDGNELR